MSMMNNRDTLEHYAGQVWLTRPKALAPNSRDEQGIHVCVEYEGDFVALEFLTLRADGLYYKKDKAIGRQEDDAFRQFIEKLTGALGSGEEALFDKVCDRYEQQGSLAAVARELALSAERVRRILITRGRLTSPLISNIAFLYDEGRGRSVPEIAALLQVSKGIVRKNMAYYG